MRGRRPGRRMLLLLLISIATVVIVFCGIAFVTNSAYSDNSSNSVTLFTQQDSASGQQVIQPLAIMPSCPDARPFQSGSASLDFCSPKYQGNVSGPYGSHITLVGENFPSTVTWYVTSAKLGNDDQNTLKQYVQTTCQPQATKDCSAVPPTATAPLDSKNPQQGSLFYWTWSTDNGFPSIASVPQDFYFLAVTGSGSNLTVIRSSVSFTLMSTEAPCLIVSFKPSDPKKQAVSSQCNQTSSVSLSPGASITIAGSNWLLQPSNPSNAQPPPQPASIKVSISADCASCNPTHIDLGSGATDNQGKFSIKKPLDKKINGMYTISAKTSVPTVTDQGYDPLTSANTIVDGALTFGNTDAGDATQLTLQIGSPPSSTATATATPKPTATATATPKPTATATPTISINSRTLDLIAIFAWLPAIIAFFLFLGVVIWSRFMAMRHPQAATNLPQENGAAIPTMQHQNGARGLLSRSSPEASNMLSQSDNYLVTPFLPQINVPRYIDYQDKGVRREMNNRVSNAAKTWQARGKVEDELTKLASDALSYSMKEWQFLLETLTHTQVNPRVQINYQELEISAARWLNPASKDKERLELYGGSLLCYTLLKVSGRCNALSLADIQRNMGFAYAQIGALLGLSTTYKLLREAVVCYKEALLTYRVNPPPLALFVTLQNIGNAYVALSQVAPQKERVQYFKLAQDSYQNALQIASEEQRMQLQEPIAYVKQQLTARGAR